MQKLLSADYERGMWRIAHCKEEHSIRESACTGQPVPGDVRYIYGILLNNNFAPQLYLLPFLIHFESTNKNEYYCPDLMGKGEVRIAVTQH
jgi:hypothetical protein